MAGRVVFAVAAWLFLVGVLVQVFLAGVGVFELADWTAHAGLGWALGSAPILLVLFALVAGVGRSTVLLTVALMIAAIIQPELAAARREAPVVAALHPVNALLVFWLAWVVARRATEAVRESRSRRGTGSSPRPATGLPTAVAAMPPDGPSAASGDHA